MELSKAVRRVKEGDMTVQEFIWFYSDVTEIEAFDYLIKKIKYLDDEDYLDFIYGKMNKRGLPMIKYVFSKIPPPDYLIHQMLKRAIYLCEIDVLNFLIPLVKNKGDKSTLLHHACEYSNIETVKAVYEGLGPYDGSEFILRFNSIDIFNYMFPKMKHVTGVYIFNVVCQDAKLIKPLADYIKILTWRELFTIMERILKRDNAREIKIMLSHKDFSNLTTIYKCMHSSELSIKAKKYILALAPPHIKINKDDFRDLAVKKIISEHHDNSNKFAFELNLMSDSAAIFALTIFLCDGFLVGKNEKKNNLMLSIKNK